MLTNLYIIDFAHTRIDEYFKLISLASRAGDLSALVRGLPSRWEQEFEHMFNVETFGYSNQHYYPRVWSSGVRFALEEVRRVVVRRALRVAGLRREVRRLLVVVLRLEERRRLAHPFLAAAERFALEVRGLRLEEVRFAVVVLRRELRLRVAAAFFAAADLLRLFAARVRAAFFAAADRLAFVVLFLPDDLRRAGALRDLRVVRAIFFTLLFLARLPPLGGFTRVSVPRAM